MTADVHQRQHRQGNGRSAPPTDPLALVRDHQLRGLVEWLDEALDHIAWSVEGGRIRRLDRDDLDYIADAIRAAADCLHDLRHGRLP